MCRNIKNSLQLRSSCHRREVRAAALQYVRKISGFSKPSKANEAAFDAAVDEVARISSAFLRSLETSAPPKNRDEEAAKAKARAKRDLACNCQRRIVHWPAITASGWRSILAKDRQFGTRRSNLPGPQHIPGRIPLSGLLMSSFDQEPVGGSPAESGPVLVVPPPRRKPTKWETMEEPALSPGINLCLLCRWHHIDRCALDFVLDEQLAAFGLSRNCGSF